MNKLIPHARRHGDGFTLVELMVSLVIGLIIIAAVGSIYVSSKQTFRTNDNFARVQENLRIAFDVLSKDVRQASYMGCAGQEADFHTTLNNPTSLLWNFSVPIYGYEATSNSTWNVAPDATIGSPLGGRDILVIRSVDDGGGPVTANASATDDILVPTQSAIAAGDVLMVSNCQVTTVFEATSITTSSGVDQIAHAAVATPSPGNSTTDLSSTFAGGELRRVSTKIYFVGTGANGIPSLFVRRSTEAAPEEFVEGIDGMEVTYGIDDHVNFSAARYISAQDVETGSLWSKVVSVQVTLTAVSPENFVAVTAQSNATGTSTDRRLRHKLTTTIALRNRAG